ncbi:MAG: M20/M25/M40 family metallo-hydrolase [Deltaproteobacteria bacterium]|nr:M20/M25/M40 family metallo-hydrolase [Deltaproteobacteria bacterium]
MVQNTGLTARSSRGGAACDMKGALASMIYGAKSLKDSGVRLKKTFVMTAVVREEMAKRE